MRVALVHDWLTGMRGGERVLERLCAMFPDAPIFTLLWNRGSTSPAIESHPIHPSFLQRLPGASRRYREYLPLFPAAIESLDLSGFDAVVSSSHAVAKGVRTRPGTFHLSYVHTPMRYVWDLEDEYFPPGRFPWPVSAFVRRTCEGLRRWDRSSSPRPTALIANSHHVAGRIRRVWGREAEVIHPPVDVDSFLPGSGPRSYYLLAGAMAPYKHGEIAVEACARLDAPLKIAGQGPEESRFRRVAGPRTEFLGRVTDEQLRELYAGARALLFPGEEDFGIVPVEAMAAGCPVIALGRGGALETVGAGATDTDIASLGARGVATVPGGVLFDDGTVDGMTAAISHFEGEAFDAAAIRGQALPFETPRFDRLFRDAYDRHLAKFRAR